jgi:23S rRNA (adenine2503-C2)-methyltransferase
MTNLTGKTTDRVIALVAPHVDRPFRARQVAHWVVRRHATSFDDMTDLSLAMRRHLRGVFEIRDPTVVATTGSGDGSTKYLFELADGVTVEGVSMPDGSKVTLCLSSQAGCAVGCTFCVTGAFGAGRNLTADEIVGQYRVMMRTMEAEAERTNIVFMGMGEPLLNTAHLGEALDVLFETVSPKRITVSTAGILPGIRWLAARPRRPKLAISLNAPDQERRRDVMPISARYPLEALMEAVRAFPLERGRRITFEYVLIRGFNDAVHDATTVARLLRGIPSKVNVIPLNEDPVHFPDLRRPDEPTVDAFARTLRDAGVTVTVRWSKGLDVDAACGQLRGRHQARSAAADPVT